MLAVGVVEAAAVMLAAIAAKSVANAAKSVAMRPQRSSATAENWSGKVREQVRTTAGVRETEKEGWSRRV